MEFFPRVRELRLFDRLEGERGEPIGVTDYYHLEEGNRLNLAGEPVSLSPHYNLFNHPIDTPYDNRSPEQIDKQETLRVRYMWRGAQATITFAKSELARMKKAKDVAGMGKMLPFLASLDEMRSLSID